MAFGINYASPFKAKPKPKPVYPARPNTGPGTARNIGAQLDYSSFNPGDPRSPLNLKTQLLNAGVARSAVNDPYQFVQGFGDYMTGMRGSGVQQTQPIFPPNQAAPGSGGRGGGGGGGGGGAAGLDQSTFDWLMAQLQNRPQTVNYRELDLPDPSQYMRWDPSQYDVARQGVTSGLAGIQDRANTAYTAAEGEVGRYANPYAGGLQTQNPDQMLAMEQMARANNAVPALQDVYSQGVQADRAFGNVQALMAANDQARQAANMRALQGDRRTTEQNLGIEGNQLNLGVNMAQARGKSSFDQALQKAMFETASQESMQNYARRNEVESQNAGTLNSWQQNVLQQILGLVGSKAPGTALPGDMSWLSLIAPGINVQGGSAPIV